MKTVVETVFAGKDRPYNRRFPQLCSCTVVLPRNERARSSCFTTDMRITSDSQDSISLRTDTKDAWLSNLSKADKRFQPLVSSDSTSFRTDDYGSPDISSDFERLSMKLVMTLLVRNEENIIASNIDFRLNNGVDFIVAMDNRSIDDTADILRRYQRKGVLHDLSQHDDTYAEGIWVTQMARLDFVQVAADWIISNEADEFWRPEHGDLKSIRASVDPLCPAVAVDGTNFIPRPIPAGEFFGDYLTIRERRSTDAFGLPLPGQVCHRALPDIEAGQGNHGATRDGRARPTMPAPITILHFPLRTYRQFANKIAKGGAAYVRNQDVPGELGRDWPKLYEVWQRGELEAYYQALIRDDEKVTADLNDGSLIFDDRLKRLRQNFKINAISCR